MMQGKKEEQGYRQCLRACCPPADSNKPHPAVICHCNGNNKHNSIKVKALGYKPAKNISRPPINHGSHSYLP
jgi:hypothetical protein